MFVKNSVCLLRAFALEKLGDKPSLGYIRREAR